MVVPIYNTQEFFPRCLDSILNQSYATMEIILVNDSPADGALTICEKYAMKDGRIQIINQLNQGALAARRNGVKSCQGKYVTFVDSDDWIEQGLLEALVQAIQKCDCSLVCTNAYMDMEDRTIEK